MDGAGSSRHHPQLPATGRRGGHRHRQNLRLPAAGVVVGKEDHHLYRHQGAAGPAVPSRPAAHRQARGPPGIHGAAQGAGQLPVPAPSRRGRRRGRGTGVVERSRRGQFLATPHRQRRSRRTDGRCRRLGHLAAGHVDRGELPGRPVSVLPGVPRGQGAARCAGGGPGGGQSPPAARGPGAQGRRFHRVPAGRRGAHPRRGAPDPRPGGTVFRRQPVEPRTGTAARRDPRGDARHGRYAALRLPGQGTDGRPGIAGRSAPSGRPARTRRRSAGARGPDLGIASGARRVTVGAGRFRVVVRGARQAARTAARCRAASRAPCR